VKKLHFLLFALAMPLSSPLACGGDACLRESDCPSHQSCQNGLCASDDPPLTAGGDAGEATVTTSTAGSATTGGTASTSQAGTTASSGTAGTTSESSAGDSSAGQSGTSAGAGASLGGASDVGLGGAG
jgi:hypothetical protein